MAAILNELMPGNYPVVAPPPPSGTFDFGLVMAGAVSAGAYTAGVLDFIIEALDSWEKKKADQFRIHGSNTRAWDIPGHNVRLRVMSGASAGAITAAIAAAALRYDFPHPRIKESRQDAGANPFYRAWVQQIDITKLLQSQDLPKDDSTVVSLLDSTVLESIAKEAISYTGPAAPERSWLT